MSYTTSIQHVNHLNDDKNNDNHSNESIYENEIIILIYSTLGIISFILIFHIYVLFYGNRYHHHANRYNFCYINRVILDYYDFIVT